MPTIASPIELTDDLIRQFWKNVDKDGPMPSAESLRIWPGIGQCWIWKDARGGYGSLSGYRAHRVSFAIHNWTPLPEQFICHKCDRKSCVNPGHLFVGTPLENARDCSVKGRKTQERRNVSGFMNILDPAIRIQIAADMAATEWSRARDIEIAKRYGVTMRAVRSIWDEVKTLKGIGTRSDCRRLAVTR